MTAPGGPKPLASDGATTVPAGVFAALARLAPTDASTVDAILLHLGYRRRTLPAAQRARAQDTSGNFGAPRKTVDSRQPAKVVEDLPSDISSFIPAILTRRGDDSPDPPDWLAETVLLSLPGDHMPAYRKRSAPLFEPQRSRALVLAMASRLQAGGRIDFERAVKMLASLELTEQLPRASQRAICGGAVMIVDIGPSMQPFLQDVHSLAQDFQDYVGRSAAGVYYSSGAPPEGFRDMVDFGFENGFRHDSRTVVAVTDFGLGNAGSGILARPHSWLAFAAQVCRSGGRLVALTPYPRKRIPALLSEAIPIVEWSRVTGVRDIPR